MSSQPEKDLAGAGSAKDTQESLSFAGMLGRLEEIVKSLESGELSLEESLSRFEEGVKLARSLESILARAESTVQQILKHGDETNSRETGEPDAVSDT